MYALTLEGGQCLAAADLCLTPTPGGPVPVAYPDTGLPGMAANTCTKVFVRGVAALHKASRIAPSNGDQAGTGGGVISASVMGSVSFAQASRIVRLQGHPAVRLGDATRHNDGNAGGAVVQPGQIQLSIAR
ncbi:MAG: DUF4150 domain-containing protein [Betaproteobacteria bacterium]|nr:DUF4150 domain-containing protein [Betaproteobacteria bacterium]MBU6512764.1 DUF4150 domain-containing protein [Betaproteobacteria bacterium]MDE1955107.1 DUF4150 domain-containing protein [Betaproteobacteria bacterium]MDE2152927.1 DUF4150 domain-containing protein [Betaproteobacteria bacterium]